MIPLTCAGKIYGNCLLDLDNRVKQDTVPTQYLFQVILEENPCGTFRWIHTAFCFDSPI